MGVGWGRGGGGERGQGGGGVLGARGGDDAASPHAHICACACTFKPSNLVYVGGCSYLVS